MPNLIPVIGMEIHAELNTKTKMFCTCPNGYELQEKPNQNICPICLAHPGMLPVINRQAVEWTILTGLALNMKVAKNSKFDRKNYFYPDLPKGYQISQYDQPLTSGGVLKVGNREIGITRIHLEEDTGMLSHVDNKSYVNLSRAGTPLMELVTDPDIQSAKEAKEFCQLYQQILRYLEISEANMERGQMRCEANISMQEAGRFVTENGMVKPLLDYKLNPKVELKNINSFKAVEKAIEYEIKRQTKAIEANEKLIQETRGWDEDKLKTFTQRVKETSADYRYFPEPDLPPLEITDELLANLTATLPELPHNKLERFVKQFKFNLEEAKLIIVDKNVADYTEEVVSELIGWIVSLPETEGTEEEIWENNGRKLVKMINNWLVNNLFKHLNEKKIAIDKCKITPENFAEFITLIYQGKINNSVGQKILGEMFDTGEDPTAIMEENNLTQMDDQDELIGIIDEIIEANPKAIEDFNAGKENSIKFLMGQVMAKTEGRANPQEVIKFLNAKLK
jgi:aspartyl-tRNA(Asn)/glutamyl-tRNA(Gln) amidotransferase subunit B